MASISQYKWYHYREGHYWHEEQLLGQRRKSQSLDTMVLVDNASRGIPGSINLLLSKRKG